MSEEDVIPDTGAIFTYGKSCFADNIPSHFFIRNDPVVEISCGEEHSGIVCKNGRVFCFGKNGFGQLGLGHTENVYKPNCVKSLKPEKVKHIACGRSHTIVSTEVLLMSSFLKMSSCHITLSREARDILQSNLAVVVVTANKQFSSDYGSYGSILNYSLINRKDNNIVYGFGDNSDGQLGQPIVDVTNSDVPVKVTQFDEKIIQISAGSYHTAVLIENGDVYVWGSNNDRQLGLDAIDDSIVVKVPTIVPIAQPVVFISCGHSHSAFVTKHGDLFTCGDREYGKLGHGLWSLSRVDTTEKIIRVACGANHTIALNDAGKVLVCGNNDCGQIGLRSVTSQGHLYPCPITNERIVQVICGENHSAFITASGKLFTCGDGKYGKLCTDVNQITIPTLVSAFVDKHLNVQMVSCGGNHTLIHAMPIDNEFANNSVQQIKSSDTLPPLKVAKKIMDERKENIEPFTIITATITSTNGYDPEVLNITEERVKQDINSKMIDQQSQVDKKSFKDNITAEEITNINKNDKSIEKEEKNTNMLVNSSKEQKEKKVVNKSKYPRNERIRSRLCVFI